jgi:hypothetical protein
MLWYYDAIIDWMIANPGRPLRECAAHVGRTPTTLSIIINSDMFKAALAQRKADFRLIHDTGLVEKTTQLAHASLDALLEVLDKKRDKVPIDSLREISDSALSRLGYGIEKNNSGVQVHVNGQATIVAPVSQQDLEEARMALRMVQNNKVANPVIEHSPTPELMKGAEPVDEVEGRTEHASADLPT